MKIVLMVLITIKPYYPETAAERRKENFGVTRSITVGRVFDSRDNIMTRMRQTYRLQRRMGRPWRRF